MQHPSRPQNSRANASTSAGLDVPAICEYGSSPKVSACTPVKASSRPQKCTQATSEPKEAHSKEDANASLTIQSRRIVAHGPQSEAIGDLSSPEQWTRNDSRRGSATHETRSPVDSGSSVPLDGQLAHEVPEKLHYHAFDDIGKGDSSWRPSHQQTGSVGSSSQDSGGVRTTSHQAPTATSSRPKSNDVLSADYRGRALSPNSAGRSPTDSPHSGARDASGWLSPAGRPVSYIDLLSNVPYDQQLAPAPRNNTSLQSVIGNAASLLDTKKTLDMYRANVKKTADPAIQYEFAIFMVHASRDVVPADDIDAAGLLTEAKHILNRLSDRAYPFAQYYLGDGYFSGLFNKGKPDLDKAFGLFIAASKHGHAEAGYRAALCYEFGWGTNKSYLKAANFYRTSASKNHPGAATRLGLACVRGDLGLGRDKDREGYKWLKRATEAADAQYNAAPFELGMLHLVGHGADIFKDEPYAAQLFTQSAELGHPEANLLLGQAYENALYGCPRDAALSVHFYNGAASRGLPEAMMALCAWYMVGADLVLEKDEGEAYAWARQAAETGFPKAQYATGYFLEMGIGCRRDPLEANVWYVRAAEQGYAAALQRLEMIRAAFAPRSSGGSSMSQTAAKKKVLGRNSPSNEADGDERRDSARERRKSFLRVF